MTIFDDLAKPFPPELVSWRVGSTKADKTAGLALAYIDARDVMERLDTVCGPPNWQNKYSHANGKTVCDIGIRFVRVKDGTTLAEEAEWIWKADGAGDSDVEAEKGALSDAFKRAAVRWGVGRYLYEIKSAWVEIVPMGKSYRIADHEHKKLEALLRGNAQPKNISREPFNKITAGIKQIVETGNVEDLRAWYKGNIKTAETFPPDWLGEIAKQFDDASAALKEKAA